MSGDVSVRGTVEEAWARVLRVDRLDQGLSFFGHGGSSLAALQAADEIAVRLDLSDDGMDAIVAALVEDAALEAVVALLEAECSEVPQRPTA